ncbi:cupin domain-containing protein [Streptomyces venezuelae]|uniref:cupin domain-containing protein n=1 Tax=Streptomyces venezuelae TaxID=54571 RepID=UPI0034573945
MSDLIRLPGEGRKLVTKAQEVTFKATGAQGSSASIFEVVVPPGFDTGGHYHEGAEEFFYILEGELELLAFEPAERTDDWLDWESADGDRVVRAPAGSSMFVPPNTPHAFRNATDSPVRMLFQSNPSPEHEAYFEEIAEIWAAGGDSVDPEAVRRMRARYDVKQITPMKFAPPTATPAA